MEQQCSGRIVCNDKVVTFVRDSKHTDRQINYGVQIAFNQTNLCNDWLERFASSNTASFSKSLQKAPKLAMAKVEKLNETDMSRTGVGRCWTPNLSRDCHCCAYKYGNLLL